MSTNSLRIGVDARPLGTRHSGIGRYTYEILARLTETTDHEWFCYTHKRLSDPPSFRNTWFRHSRFVPPACGSIHAQIMYPLFAKRDNLDVFWSPRHHLPILIGVRTVVTIHDLVWKAAPETMAFLNRVLDRVLMPLAVNKARYVIANSAATARDIAGTFRSGGEKTDVIHLGGYVETEAVEPKHTVLFVGTFEPRKNLERLVNAFAMANDPDDPWQLVLAGNQGWRLRPIEDIVNEAGVNDSVRIERAPNDDELHQLYADAAIVALPALYEGFGLPIVEGMSHGRPLLCSNVSSLPEVAGDAAVYVDPTSTEDIADGLSRLMTDVGLRCQLGKVARARARQFRWDSTAAATLRILERAAQD